MNDMTAPTSLAQSREDTWIPTSCSMCYGTFPILAPRGDGAHLVSGMMHASWSAVPDFEHCNYTIFFGASKGHGAGHASISNMGLAAEARARGMKMVVVDPMCNFASAKATEWGPLRVGPDGALGLS